jgi:hypothetical protein
LKKRAVMLTMLLLSTYVTSSFAISEEDEITISPLYTAYCYGYLSSQSDKPKMKVSLANEMRENASKLFDTYKSLLVRYDGTAFKTILEREYSKGKESTQRSLSISELYIIRDGCNVHSQKISKETAGNK